MRLQHITLILTYYSTPDFLVNRSVLPYSRETKEDLTRALLARYSDCVQVCI
ncbi:hypothetical protein HanXRQr2_Chr15g0715371 [Helianthus annuus]|uniref:Uncharacterized protein n=1 Tax=Helianthus annuus TaxID=4232 RepID=A0A9K3H4V7_HELAN|nr:hypothetical protein HanXRQr2_Chr15g0715371 [Helianthus annuus]KAJ0833100.1 hypothetical protein HanPSC8_Chr15g0686421 [Helianthus annuus]